MFNVRSKRLENYHNYLRVQIYERKECSQLFHHFVKDVWSIHWGNWHHCKLKGAKTTKEVVFYLECSLILSVSTQRKSQGP